MDPAYTSAALSAGIVAIVCGIVAVASWRAVIRTGNRAIQFIAVAFVILAAKNLLKTISLASGTHEGPITELAFSLTDLAAVLLVAWPLVVRRQG